MEKKEKKLPRKFRKQGRRLKTLDPYYAFTPFIMKRRQDASNYYQDSVDISKVESFLREKRAQGMKGLGMLHFFVAAYVRTVSQRPFLNRYVSGQRIYARNNIEVVMTVKKEMRSDAGETSIKVVFDPRDTLKDVYDKMEADILKIQTASESSSTDDVAGSLIKMPRLLLKFCIWLISVLDYFSLVPKFLRDASPFHGSMVITDIGSLGIPPIFHHLYDFGNVPIFLSFGTKQRSYEPQKDGSVVPKRTIDFIVTMDERICDGFYFATSFKYFKRYFLHPELLDTPPETVEQDVDLSPAGK